MEKAKKKLAGGGGGTVVLMIGLYLIILAFFILLNAISESSESKYEQTSNSLKNSFGFQAGEVEPSEEGVTISAEEFYSGIAQKLTGIIASYFPANNYDVTSETGKIIITVPLSNMFDKGEVSVNPMVYSFFYDMISTLNNLSTGISIQMEMNMEVAKSYENDATDHSALEEGIRRICDIAAIIKQESPRFEKISTSVNLGERSVVHFYVIFDIQDYQQALLSYRDFIQ